MIIKLRENEPFEVALRRFKRAIEKTGLLTELRARESYEKPTTERKRKHAAACKRHYKQAFSLDKVEQIIREGRGTHFDPDVADAYFALRDQFQTFATSFADHQAPHDHT